MAQNYPTNVSYLDQMTSRKVKEVLDRSVAQLPDSLSAWITCYLRMVVVGVRSDEVTRKIALHLQRFRAFFAQAYGDDRISICLRRDVTAWQQHLQADGLAPSTVNNHLASLSAFTTWVHAQDPQLFVGGDPTKGISELGLPPLEPRSLDPDQVRSLKNVCDRLDRFYQLKNRKLRKKREVEPTRVRAHGRPWRDRAIVYVLLSTGLRREELVELNLDQIEPHTPEALRAARQGKITHVKGKGKTERTVFLSADARVALADYLEKERLFDCNEQSLALFLSAVSIAARRGDGRLSPRSINLILLQIGRWHDADIRDPKRHISPLHPHALRHTFAFQLSQATSADTYELERRLGHRSQRYIQRYTNPPEQIAASYVEKF